MPRTLRSPLRTADGPILLLCSASHPRAPFLTPTAGPLASSAPLANRSPADVAQPDDAAVPPGQTGRGGGAAAVPHGRLLRAVLRRRQGRRPAAGHHAHRAGQGGVAREGVEPTPMAGFPYHQLDTYLAKIIRAGRRAAVCEQVEDPKQAKGIVKRDITRIRQRRHGDRRRVARPLGKQLPGGGRVRRRQPHRGGVGRYLHRAVRGHGAFAGPAV